MLEKKKEKKKAVRQNGPKIIKKKHTNVKHWLRKLNMSKMARAFRHGITALKHCIRIIDQSQCIKSCNKWKKSLLFDT
jgi:hypothetical protein